MNAELSEGKWSDPVLPREPDKLPDDLPRGAQIPDDLDPLADGVLMEHQADWSADDSDLKIAEKGRRTGITFAEALDDTLIAAAKRSAGGQNVFYIGDTKDKGREFIGYVKHFASIVAKELVTIEEFMFEDVQDDGSSKFISAFRIRFASGFRVEALSSRPENIRGLQGVVVIDEAAFHKNVREVLDAVNALLIWGGKIRVISSHNGVLNPFNELIREARAKKVPFSVHTITFGDAVKNGLFKRVCFMKGEEWTFEKEIAWEAKIRAAYGARTTAMKQELDAIPADATGAALTRVMIERIKDATVPVKRWRLEDDFKNLEKHSREAVQRDYCERELKPVLDNLNPKRQHVIGMDFARTGDVSALRVYEIGEDTIRRLKLVLEMRNITYDQQRDTVFYVGDRLPRFVGGAFDRTGNGGYLAEAAVLRWGDIIHAIHLSQEWYRDNSPAYIEAVNDMTVTVAADEDDIRDHQSLQFVNGIIRVPDNHRHKGEDGFDRHGDNAIAAILAWFASIQITMSYGYESRREMKPDTRRERSFRREERTINPSLRGTL